jgi:hypothetical protein
MDRTTKALLKHANSNKPSKLQQLQLNFDEYKRNNEVKLSAITELRKENNDLHIAVALALKELENQNLMNDTYWRIQTLLDSK